MVKIVVVLFADDHEFTITSDSVSVDTTGGLEVEGRLHSLITEVGTLLHEYEDVDPEVQGFVRASS